MSSPWSASVITLFPEMFPGPLSHSLAGRALEEGRWTLETVDMRAFARDKHGSVDDAPFGGGPGMVLCADVVSAALKRATAQTSAAPAICLSPRGTPLTQKRVAALAEGVGATLICGRFEGIDERVLEAHEVEEISLGDYVLSGGEPAAICLIDACVRLLPGIVGEARSLDEESFTEGLLEYPHYTRPEVWEGRAVPGVLLSGHHAKIREWRRSAAERLTRERRPDLWERYRTDKDKTRSRP
jgi:tRNA (guanine37-N1)-methyltransferase